MNLYSELGSRWLGRCLIQVKGFKKEKPDLSCMSIDEVDKLVNAKKKGQYLKKQLAKAERLTNIYEMRSEIYYGMMLPEKPKS